jgi:hypothetical protein
MYMHPVGFMHLVLLVHACDCGLAVG